MFALHYSTAFFLSFPPFIIWLSLAWSWDPTVEQFLIHYMCVQVKPVCWLRCTEKGLFPTYLVSDLIWLLNDKPGDLVGHSSPTGFSLLKADICPEKKTVKKKRAQCRCVMTALKIHVLRSACIRVTHFFTLLHKRPDDRDCSSSRRTMHSWKVWFCFINAGVVNLPRKSAASPGALWMPLSRVCIYVCVRVWDWIW